MQCHWLAAVPAQPAGCVQVTYRRPAPCVIGQVSYELSSAVSCAGVVGKTPHVLTIKKGDRLLILAISRQGMKGKQTRPPLTAWSR